MADPLTCLRISTIAIGIWNIVYCLVQLAVFGWQIKFCRDRQWELENRNSEVPDDPANRFQARFPGLYGVYSETPERRRINACFAIAITTLVVTCAHLVLTLVLIIGAFKYYANCIWPFLISGGLVVGLSTAYAVIWWSGDVFGEQLAMSVAEFIMSLAVNGICLGVVAFFFFRMRGSLTSVRPKEKSQIGYREKHLPKGVPEWRTEWKQKPPKTLAKKLRSERSRSPHELSRQTSGRRYGGERFQRDEKFRRLSLSPEGSPPQYTPSPEPQKFLYSRTPEPQRMAYAVPPESQRILRSSCEATGGRTTSNFLYLSQERLNEHNAHMEKRNWRSPT